MAGINRRNWIEIYLVLFGLSSLGSAAAPGDQRPRPIEKDSRPRMSAILVAEIAFLPGEAWLAGDSPSGKYSVEFVDDGDAGYFYAYDLVTYRELTKDNKAKGDETPIVDAMHIYNVDWLDRRYFPSKAQIAWSKDGMKAMLLVNETPQAVFDFEARRGYCRTNFPPPDRRWTEFDHAWDDAALELFE